MFTFCEKKSGSSYNRQQITVAYFTNRTQKGRIALKSTVWISIRPFQVNGRQWGAWESHELKKNSRFALETQKMAKNVPLPVERFTFRHLKQKKSKTKEPLWKSLQTTTALIEGSQNNDRKKLKSKQYWKFFKNYDFSFFWRKIAAKLTKGITECR